MIDHSGNKPRSCAGRLVKHYQIYKAFVEAPGGAPPPWLSPAENYAFAKIHASPLLSKAMDDFARDLVSVSTLGAYGAAKARKLYPNNLEKQIGYASAFEVLGEVLGKLGRGWG